MIICRNILVANFFVVLYTGTSDVAKVTSNPLVKIVGGDEVTIMDYPYQVSVKLKSKHICGGSLLNERFVLTAAHCFIGIDDNVQQLSIGMGNTNSSQQMLHPVKSVLINPYFNVSILENRKIRVTADIALIELISPVRINNVTIRPIPLADEKPEVDEWCTVTGWGATNASNPVAVDLLRAVRVPIVDPAVCLEIFQAENNDSICAGYLNEGKDSCQGDSGGPLGCGGRLVGVVSWGLVCGEGPGMYTSVYHYLDWIRNNTNSNYFRAIPDTKLLIMAAVVHLANVYCWTWNVASFHFLRRIVL